MELAKREYDLLNEIESWLYNYKGIKISIENLKLELESIDVLASSDPCKENCKTNKFNSNVENTVSQKETLEQKINITENKLCRLDKALGALNVIELKVIEKFYFEGLHYYEFSHEIPCSERSCKRIRKRALNKIIIAMNGIQ